MLLWTLINRKNSKLSFKKIICEGKNLLKQSCENYCNIVWHALIFTFVKYLFDWLPTFFLIKNVVAQCKNVGFCKTCYNQRGGQMWCSWSSKDFSIRGKIYMLPFTRQMGLGFPPIAEKYPFWTPPHNKLP